jgi:hypothetical protein
VCIYVTYLFLDFSIITLLFDEIIALDNLEEVAGDDEQDDDFNLSLALNLTFDVFLLSPNGDSVDFATAAAAAALLIIVNSSTDHTDRPVV